MTFDELLELSDIENVSRGGKEVLEVMRKVAWIDANGQQKRQVVSTTGYLTLGADQIIVDTTKPSDI